jgi:O-acetyl-ADP-ribose deacetylase (regulator of RNase III)
MLTDITGDLFDPAHRFEAIGHGVNLHGVMGAGIAVRVRTEFPGIMLPYRVACRTGELTIGGFQAYEAPNGQVVYNLASQVDPGPDARYDAVEASVAGALADCTARGITRLALPQIGSDIGGLEWDNVHEILARLSDESGVDITAVTFAG